MVKKEVIGLILFIAIFSCCERKKVGEYALDGEGHMVGTAVEADGRSASKCEREADWPLEGVKSEEEDVSYWLRDGDSEVVMGVGDIAAHNLGYKSRISSMDTVLEHGEVVEMVKSRLESLGDRFKAGKLSFVGGGKVKDRFWDESLSFIDGLSFGSRKVILLEDVMLHCGPHLEAYVVVPDGEARFSRNNCSMAKKQELVDILFEYPVGMYFVRTAYSWGWISKDTKFSKDLNQEEVKKFLGAGVDWMVVRDVEVGGVRYAKGALFKGDAHNVFWADEGGLHWDGSGVGMVSSLDGLSRETYLRRLFLFLGDPYGWGGEGGHRDCSRLLMDVMRSFGLSLPRHSGDQAKSGSFMIDVSQVSSESMKMRIIDEAHKRGIVFLRFPGHIMAYLGRDLQGEPKVFHAFSEYLEPGSESRVKGCEGDVLVHVDKVSVSDLRLGAGSARRSFLERISDVVVFTNDIGSVLDGMAKSRPIGLDGGVDLGLCKEVKGKKEVMAWVFPLDRSKEESYRIVVSDRSGRGDLRLKSFGLLDSESGKYHALMGDYRGGAVRSLEARSDVLKSSKGWSVLLGGGGSCGVYRKFSVGRGGQSERRERRWSAAYEDLYSYFVERLFSYPVGEELSWPNLHSILLDEERNILFSQEDKQLKLKPDCADFPYFLRAYFAWKLGLPMGYRKCSRGKSGVAPKCGELLSSELSLGASARDFMYFVNGLLRNAVHSGSGRTLPEDSASDLYPVALTRESLRPGTVYADPYGHILVLVGFVPQGVDSPGQLYAVDAQPDGTISRRRFWRGTFLFDPARIEVGAGFKAFRPVRMENGVLVSEDNSLLRSSDEWVPYSEEMYEGSVDDFYDKMDALINPLALEPLEEMRMLVDSLEESAKRRVISVDNGEAYVLQKGVGDLRMPKGYSIFETSGAWEDYATPSRDMRLLLAIDAVKNYPERVKRQPERYGLDVSGIDSYVRSLEEALVKELESRHFSYRGSHGEEEQLSLKDLIDREKSLEVAYHPGDCIEVRWGAFEGSEEMKRCNRRAKVEDRKRMEEYRVWFRERRRPSR